ncbi:MAG: hypothetical protein KDD10_10885 [Phaeodactylibacter sp.]|nr:hypothetical protein [Phaeodactylibacter sp.]MCB9296552.1 hypothetical protein [Lewinellaceae bacterium]
MEGLKNEKYWKRPCSFKELSKTRKQVFLTLITTFSLEQNQHSLGLIDVSLTMDCLFEKEVPG